MIFNMSGSGGAGLAFKIVGGTSRPTSQTDNLIWINTEADIPEYFISSFQPEAAVDGAVWIVNGTASPVMFNLVKKNTIYVYPISCKQKMNDTWMPVEAHIYMDDWRQFSSVVQYLFNNGETSIVWQGTGTDTATELIMWIDHTIYNGSYGDYGRKYSSEPITIPSGFTRLCIKYYCTGTKQLDNKQSNMFVLRSDNDAETYYSQTNVVAFVSIPFVTEESVASIEITEALYEQQLYVGTYYNSHENVENKQDYHITQIWFE